MKLKVLLLALVFSISFTGIFTPAAKAEGPAITPFVDIAMWTGVTRKDKDANAAPAGDGKAKNDFTMGVIPESDFGIRGTFNGLFVSFSGMAKTVFGGSATENYQLSLFTAFFTYTFEGFGFTMGRAFTPYGPIDGNNVASTTIDAGNSFMLGYTFFDPVRDQIKIDYKGFYVGIFKSGKNEDSKSDAILPLIAAGYAYGNWGTPLLAAINGLVQTYEIRDAANPADGKRVNSYGAEGNFIMTFAPVSFQVQGFYGINAGDMGYNSFAAGMIPQSSAVTSTGSIEDTTSLGGFANVSYTIGNAKASVGFGYRQDDNDKYLQKGKQMEYYVALRYAIQPNFAITPTVNVQDGMEDINGVKRGKTIAMGFQLEGHL